ncbi:MAG: UvrD-helicase domain-containing protein [Bacilli bacterium]|jgi:DNA helicase-2/ATP-dependent DNA helicase PcrA|nr:UvrD-helicase domain-containing protein [Bacilli bacterium]MDD2681752.1 UvrD-helicase domain-containing protein [Bacilli bacterium]MDD3121339.1 UvrD-helicase domain-containing protein [Bacilli bacterium]MDD4063410.1 UvrD-helicase domain-containing protein [Bacilli bacterium]MDY0363110.1 UvrD-helicase domain-containing protein [Bacilli bacterium]
MLNLLNDKQKEAVLRTEGPVIIYAGAGSGKTRTLTYRIAYMIEYMNIPPFNILAITFTNKATNEMKFRLSEMLGNKLKELTISTFHSFCVRILRKEIKKLGYENNFFILDDEDQLKIINEIYKEENYNKSFISPKQMQNKLNYYKCHDIKADTEMEISILRSYERKTKEYNSLDFQDLLIKTRELFAHFPRVLEKYQEKYKYILIDEFQDTDNIQYDIIKMLANKYKNIFVVGDDDQSIYSFRGTNFKNMHFFKKDFEGCFTVYLTQNYRSTQTILDGANKLISHNENREAKELFSNIEGSKYDVTIFQAYNEKEEVDYVLDEISTLKNKGYKHKNIAILYRNSSILRNYELGMIHRKLPYKIYGGISYLRRMEIKDAIAYLKLLVDDNDFFSLKRIINVPVRNIGLTSVYKLELIKREKGYNIFNLIENSLEVLTEAKYKSLLELKKIIVKYKSKLEQDSLVNIFSNYLTEIGYYDFLKGIDDNIDRVDNLNEFKSILYTMDEEDLDLNNKEKLLRFFDEATLSDNITRKTNNNGILLSTIHSVKGLEFDVVFLVAMEEGIFPNPYRFVTEEEIEEERRVAYVAVTRAKQKLFLTNSKTRLLYGNTKRNSVSRFLLEFTGENNNSKTSTFLEAEPHKFFDEREELVLQSGDKVLNLKYGEGTVLKIEKDIAQIVFPKSGVITKFLIDSKFLKKI